MSLDTLSIQGIRNLANTQLTLSSGVNVFYGDNGAGKTSILEGLHLLAMTRSFRQSRTRTLISHEEDDCLVIAKDSELGRVSVRRNAKGQLQIRLNGETVKGLSELAHKMPLQLIHSDSFLLLEGTPSDRRQFLDWGVFHQFPEFTKYWKNLQKSLKNRNSLLRSGRMERSELQVWEDAFLTASDEIDKLRKAYLSEFVPLFHEVLGSLIDLPKLKVHYFRGWDKERPLPDVLNHQRERDQKLGYTQSGPQRADMRIKVSKVNAADELSRGQQKLVVCALKISQSLYLQRRQQRSTLFLLDDLPSELDQEHIRKLGELMEGLDGQVFMTCVDPSPLKEFWQHPERVKMFHVEHGAVREHMEFGDKHD